MEWPPLDAEHIMASSSEMVKIEDHLFSYGLPEEALMEKAALRMSHWIKKNLNLKGEKIIVLVGPGNNGGDGLVIARELFLSGKNVVFWCPIAPKSLITKKHLMYVKKIGIKEGINLSDVNQYTIIIDAIFGLNQHRPLPKYISDVFRVLKSKNNKTIVSIDVPTGICSDTGRPLSGDILQSSYTLTVGLYKKGLIQDCSIPNIGDLIRVDLDVPKFLIKNIFSNSPRRITASDLMEFDFKKPPHNAHKYKRGRLLVIAGSDKYPGAGMLSLRGSLSSGVGIVRAIVPEIVGREIPFHLPEIIIEKSLSSNKNGLVLVDKFIDKENLAEIDAILVGPGIGSGLSDWNEDSKLLEEFHGLLVIDADGINRIANSKMGWKWLLKRSGRTLLTPHIKEFQRLFKDLCFSEPLSAANEAANKSGTAILLKGAHSIFASPENELWQIDKTGPWSARAGLGDLLAGFISGIGALTLASHQEFSWDVFAFSALLHAEASKSCSEGSTASLIANNLDKLTREFYIKGMS